MSFVKNLTRKERQHKEALVKAEASIKVAFTNIAGKDNEDDGNDLMRNVQVRPKTPGVKDIVR